MVTLEVNQQVVGSADISEFSSLHKNSKVELMEFYMRRKGKLYFRSSFGKLRINVSDISAYDCLLLGEKYKMEYTW